MSKPYHNRLKIKGFYHFYQYMYIYLINCSYFYKIGFSKNPQNRLKTIKTHNPLKVTLFATLKTDKYIELEKELHDLFSSKRTNGEWFELKNDDLTKLKIDYGFQFKKNITLPDEYVVGNEKLLKEVKSLRIDNHKLDSLVEYFESIFNCEITNKVEIRKCSIKFDLKIIKEAIDSLCIQSYSPIDAYDMLYKVCCNKQAIIDDPAKYITKIIKAIFYKQYKWALNQEDLDMFKNRLAVNSENAEDIIKTLNSKKFYLDSDELLDFIMNNYMV